MKIKTTNGKEVIKVRKIRSGQEEERIYDSQAEEIEKKYGKRISDHANYGWGVDGYVVCTKVYETGKILSSYYVSDRIIHEWEDR